MKQAHFRVVLLFGLLSIACTTKVSEWVLLNAPANRYTLVYFYKDAAAKDPAQMNDALVKGFNNANISLVEQESENAAMPYYALYYGGRQFERYSSASDLTNLIVSPMRNRIAAELMAGKLCVLLYLSTGDNSKDERGRVAVKNVVSASPFSDIITIIELNRNSVEEKHFASMLLNVESDLKTIREPMLFGIFGKFKALEPLVASGITEENIGYMIDFLTADCSCLIKDDLPGTDILFDSNWENPATAMVNKILDENPSLVHH